MDEHKYKDKMASQIVRDELANRTIGQGTRRGSAVWRARLQKTKEEILNMDEHAMRAQSANRVYLRPRRTKLKLSWASSDAGRYNKKKLKERFSKYGIVKHVHMASSANGNYAHIIFRTEQGAKLAFQGHESEQQTDIIEYGKEEPVTKILVEWEEAHEHDDKTLFEAFKKCGEIHSIQVESKKGKKALINFESQTGAENALSHAGDFEDMLLHEYEPTEEMPPDIVRKARLAAHKGHVIPDTEVKALRDLFLALDGPHWKNRYGWENPDSLSTGEYCTRTDYNAWWGLQVKQGRVTRIELPNNGLKGKLPSSIGRFECLEALWLHNNEITGDVPEEIGNLRNLHSLYLHSNQFKRLPREISNLHKLELLGLERNTWDIGGINKEVMQSLPRVKLDDDWPLEQC